MMNQEPQEQRMWTEELQKHLLFMEHQGLRQLSQSGSFWLGDSPSLVDFSYYPWFERWAALEQYRGISLPADCDRLQQWWVAMNQRDSVQATLQPAEFHIQQYAKYANDSASGVTAQELRRY
nr:glutathione S-transferase C-terminal domain-containing protein [Oculatella sp. LEGE 06141]